MLAISVKSDIIENVLQGKRVIFVGNSMTYYGKTAVPGGALIYDQNSFIVRKSASDGYHPKWGAYHFCLYALLRFSVLRRAELIAGFEYLGKVIVVGDAASFGNILYRQGRCCEQIAGVCKTAVLNVFCRGKCKVFFTNIVYFIPGQVKFGAQMRNRKRGGEVGMYILVYP